MNLSGASLDKYFKLIIIFIAIYIGCLPPDTGLSSNQPSSSITVECKNYQDYLSAGADERYPGFWSIYAISGYSGVDMDQMTGSCKQIQAERK